MLDQIKEKAVQAVWKAAVPTILKALEDAKPAIKAAATQNLKDWDIPLLPDDLEKPIDEILAMAISSGYDKLVETINGLLLPNN